MLGVKLMILSESVSLFLSRSGVCGSGTDLPRRRVGVDEALSLSLLRKLSDVAVRDRLVSVGVGVVSLEDEVHVESSLVDFRRGVVSKILIVAPIVG
jgi:hypothetical protein